MTHIFCNNIIGEEVIITGDDVNHIRNVLRMRAGEELLVSDGSGHNVTCTITSIDENEVICRIDDHNAEYTELENDIVLYQSLPKGDKMETIIQKCTELGVARIVPVETCRCVVKLDSKNKAKKVERWQKIAESAAEQSRRSVIPVISPVMSYEEAIRDAQKLSESILAYERSDDAELLKHILTERRGSLGIFIGPEGGYSEAEVQKAHEAGIKAITLGKRILRTETAGMALIAAIMLNEETR